MNPHLRTAILARVTASEHGTTAPAVAALLNVDLRLAEAALRALVASGDIEQAGVLYRAPASRQAA